MDTTMPCWSHCPITFPKTLRIWPTCITRKRRAHKISLAKWRKEQLSIAIRQIGQHLDNETDQEAYKTPSLSYHLIPCIGAMPRQEVQDFYNWRGLWPLLQMLGWRAICLNNETLYKRQMCDPGDGKITLGVDYFSSPEEVIGKSHFISVNV